MRKHNTITIVTAALIGVAALGGGTARAQLTPFSAAGPNAAAIQATVDGFRAALGTDNGVGGTFASGRREIDWEAVPNAFSDPNPLPGNFYNTTIPVGAVLATPGTGFLVSDSAAGGNGQPVRFGFPGDFSAFSGEKLFTPLNSSITDVTFRVPGSGVAATVSGFGAVFTDVETEGVTRLDFFAADSSLLGSLFSPVTGNGGLAFVGATSTVPLFRVRVTTGSSALVGNGNAGSAQDVVVMDNLIFGEPQAASAPEPSPILLLGVGLGLFAARRRGRRGAWERLTSQT